MIAPRQTIAQVGISLCETMPLGVLLRPSGGFSKGF